MMADLGYANASFAQITERAGLSSPRMISCHFTDKNDLIRQILIEVFKAGARYINEHPLAADSDLSGLRAYLEANLRFLRDHPGEFRDFDIRSMAIMIRGAVDGAGRRLRQPGVTLVALVTFQRFYGRSFLRRNGLRLHGVRVQPLARGTDQAPPVVGGKGLITR